MAKLTREQVDFLRSNETLATEVRAMWDSLPEESKLMSWEITLKKREVALATGDWIGCIIYTLALAQWASQREKDIMGEGDAKPLSGD